MKIKNAFVGATTALVLSLGAAALSGEPAVAVAPHVIAHPCHATVTYGNGPGKGINSKNYRAYDPYCGGDGLSGNDWYGPWRLKKQIAQGDANAHNGLYS